MQKYYNNKHASELVELHLNTKNNKLESTKEKPRTDDEVDYTRNRTHIRSLRRSLNVAEKGNIKSSKISVSGEKKIEKKRKVVKSTTLRSSKEEPPSVRLKRLTEVPGQDF